MNMKLKIERRYYTDTVGFVHWCVCAVGRSSRDWLVETLPHHPSLLGRAKFLVGAVYIVGSAATLEEAQQAAMQAQSELLRVAKEIVAQQQKVCIEREVVDVK